MKKFLLGLLILSPMLVFAEESVDAYAEVLIKALNDRDAKAYESLIYPDSLSRSIQTGQAKHDKKIALILSQKRPSDYPSFKVEVTDISQDKDYDVTTNTVYMFGNRRATFPVQLEIRLTVFVSELDAESSGKWTTPLTTQVLTKYKGNWYMVWPTQIK